MKFIFSVATLLLVVVGTNAQVPYYQPPYGYQGGYMPSYGYGYPSPGYSGQYNPYGTGYGYSGAYNPYATTYGYGGQYNPYGMGYGGMYIQNPYGMGFLSAQQKATYLAGGLWLNPQYIAQVQQQQQQQPNPIYLPGPSYGSPVPNGPAIYAPITLPNPSPFRPF